MCRMLRSGTRGADGAMRRRVRQLGSPQMRRHLGVQASPAVRLPVVSAGASMAASAAAARASATWLNRYRCSRGVKAADQAPVVTRQRQHNTTLPATVANSCSLLRACHTVQLVRKGPPPQAIAHHPPNSQHGSPPLLTRIVVAMEYRNAGRLGNMMFLYAAGFGMACHSGVRLMLTNSNRSRSFCNAFPSPCLVCRRQPAGDSCMHCGRMPHHLPRMGEVGTGRGSGHHDWSSASRFSHPPEGVHPLFWGSMSRCA